MKCLDHFFRNLLKLGLLCLLLVNIGACKPKQTEQPIQNETTIIAEAKPLTTTLHFKGTLAPIESQSVLSPTDGRITQIFFNYGQQIEKGQKLVAIDATKLSEEYRKTVTDFLEKKQNYETGVISFQGTEALYKAGVISKEEYSNAYNRQKSDTLSYFQARYDLEKLLPKTQISIDNIEKLTLSDMEKVNKILTKTFTEINVVSPAAGIALIPLPSEKKTESGSGVINIGDEVKNGQLIVSIGDLSGFSMKINVSEININLIKKGAPAIITGDAFPGISLKGSVVSVAAQANPQSNETGLGMFDVKIKIPNLTTEQKQVIHVGMSAKAQLNIEETPQILLPIKAVFTQNGQRMVTIIDKSGQRQNKAVVTGKTTLTDVAIVSGISPGDKVVVPH